jgi:Phage tail assembly chaperone protein
MEIRIRETGNIVTEQEFRRMFPNTGFPTVLTEQTINDFGADVVFEGPQATGGDHYQYSQRQGVEQVDGKWYTKYVLGPVFTDYTGADGILHTAADQEANYKAMKDADQAQNVRSNRNAMLGATDWRFRTDMNPSQEWKDYCQALRDITSQVGFPWDIQWPDEPKE